MTYDALARVPLVVAGPPGDSTAGVPGRRIETPVSLVDLMSRFCALAGTEPPDGTQGEDLTPLLAGGPAPSREAVLIEGNDGFKAVRSERYKLLFHRSG